MIICYSKTKCVLIPQSLLRSCSTSRVPDARWLLYFWQPCWLYNSWYSSRWSTWVMRAWLRQGGQYVRLFLTHSLGTGRNAVILYLIFIYVHSSHRQLHVQGRSESSYVVRTIGMLSSIPVIPFQINERAFLGLSTATFEARTWCRGHGRKDDGRYKRRPRFGSGKSIIDKYGDR